MGVHLLQRKIAIDCVYEPQMNSPKGAIFFFVVGCLCLVGAFIAEWQRDQTMQFLCAAGVVCWIIACVRINRQGLEAQSDLAFFFAQGYVDPCTATVADFMGDSMVCERKRQREHRQQMEQQRQEAAAAQRDRDWKHQETIKAVRRRS